MRQISIIVVLFIFGLNANCQYVTDNGSFFSETEVSKLNTSLKKLEDKTTIQTIIYTTKDLGDKTTLEYAKELSIKYPAGVKGINNGIIILLSKNDRKLQILVGYGLEWLLSDSQSQLIVDQMILSFKKGEFYNGANEAIEIINQKVANVDWSPNKFEKLSNSENGKIYKVQYTNKTGKTSFKYALDTDSQFSSDFKIQIEIYGTAYNLFYSKYMNDLVSKILTKDNITVYFRLVDFDSKRLELIGIK